LGAAFERELVAFETGFGWLVTLRIWSASLGDVVLDVLLLEDGVVVLECEAAGLLGAALAEECWERFTVGGAAAGEGVKFFLGAMVAVYSSWNCALGKLKTA